jgi:hypothetical protein
MRYPGPETSRGSSSGEPTPRGRWRLRGSYQARLTAHGQTFTEPFEIVKDPRLITVTQADFEEQFRLSTEIAARVDDAHRAVLQIRGVREQVDDRLGRATTTLWPGGRDLQGGDQRSVEEEVYQVRLEARQDPLNFPIKLNNQIAAIRGVVESADARPTDQSREAFTFLSGELDVQLNRLQVLFNDELGRLNDRLRSLGLDPITVPVLEENRITF